MTRRELAIRLMKADGATDEHIAFTFKLANLDAFMDGEVVPGEEEAVKRMFAVRHILPNTDN